MCGGDVTTEAMQDAEWEPGREGLVIAVVCLVFGLISLTWPFDRPWTSLQFSSDDVPTINDRGDIDCGGSNLKVVLHGPRVAIPPGDLARRAEEACREEAIATVWWGVIGLALVALGGGMLVRRAWRYQARRRAEGPGDSGERMVPDLPLLENGSFVRTD